MIIAFAVAASENNVIGKDNQLLWSLPNDMKFFKNTTWGFPVIMGRKTFESLGKPLAGRTNIVITRQKDYTANGIIVVPSLEEALKAAASTDALEAFVIGGGEIFKQALPVADKIVLTRVHTVIDGDAFFPELNPGEWAMEWHQDHEADEKHAWPYSFQIWRRQRGPQ
ncbi:MAG: dihydrofolate reductase [Chitinophagaceae bacterium]|nr:dihydrofolate reductase [Chitinophagaceae bacterium]